MLHIQALNKAKINLMSRTDSAFFTTICFSLKHVWDEKVSTACTQGTEIRFNPNFFMSLDAEERVFLLIHETMHVAYLHMERLGQFNPAKWNVAADHVINLQLIERGYKMPSMGLANPQYKGMSTEEVYKLLPEQDESKTDMDLKPYEGKTEELQEAVKDILVRAAVQSKIEGDKIGTIPGEIQFFLDRLLKPKLPWNRILQKYLHAMAKNDYTFKKPNRRFFPKHHLPSLYSENLMDLAIAVDISGSVSDTEFTTFVTETNSILRMMKPNKINLIQFDTEIKSITEIKTVKNLADVQFEGRGGTDIRPVLEWTAVKKPQLLLVFTDGYFRFGDATSNTNTLWLIHNNKKFSAPFGKTIHYEIET